MNVPQNDMNLSFDNFKETEAQQNNDPYIQGLFKDGYKIDLRYQGVRNATEVLEKVEQSKELHRTVARNCMMGVGFGLSVVFIIFLMF